MIFRATLCIIIIVAGLTRSANCQQIVEGELYTPLEQGRFKGAERVGIWNYFDHPSRVALTIDYSKGELLYIAEDKSPYRILEQGKPVEATLARPCRFHGSYLPLFQHYVESVSVPYSLISKASDKHEVVSTLLRFEVGEEGVAKNPKIFGDVNIVPRELMKAFETAPNVWIGGLKEDGTPVTCLLGIQFKICVDSCVADALPEARIIQTLGTTIHTKQKPRDKFVLTNESQGIQYSPDEKHILVETPALGYTSSAGRETEPVGLIINRETGQDRMVPFSNVNGCVWMNNDEIYFKYSIKMLPNMPAVFSMASGKVKTYSDSITYFNVFSNDWSRLAFSKRSGRGVKIMTKNTVRGDHAEVFENRTSRYIPMSWSPRNDLLLINGVEDGLSQSLLVNLMTLERKIIPLFDAFFSGWSADQRFMYFVKYDEPNLTGSIYSYDLEKSTISEVYSKIRGLSQATFSSEANLFAIIMKDDAHLLPLGKEFKSTKVMNGVVNLTWNRTGKLLCMAGEKDHQLYEYSLETGQTKKLTNWNIK